MNNYTNNYQQLSEQDEYPTQSLNDITNKYHINSDKNKRGFKK